MKTRLELPDPEVKIAVLLVEPVSSSRVGVPPVVTTVTASVKATVIVIESPALYEPSAVEEVTPVIVGAVLSEDSSENNPGSRTFPAVGSASFLPLSLT